jgi:hypothetical protein
MSREIKHFLLARHTVAAGIESKRHCQEKELTGRQNGLRTSHDGKKAINIEQKYEKTPRLHGDQIDNPRCCNEVSYGTLEEKFGEYACKNLLDNKRKECWS